MQFEKVSNHPDTENASIGLVEKTIQEIEEVIRSGNYGYDDLIMPLILNFPMEHVPNTAYNIAQDAGGIEARRKREVGEPNYYESLKLELNEIITYLESILVGLSRILVDPLIVLRRRDFVRFLQNSNIELNTLTLDEIRQKFIDTFPVKTYYRALVFEGDPQQKLSPYAKGALPENVIHTLDKHKNALLKLKDNNRYHPDKSGTLRIIAPLFLSDFQQSLMHHINNNTGTLAVSVSESPEVCWFAACENTNSSKPEIPPLWKNFSPVSMVRIYTFEASSFYVLPRTDVFSIYLQREPIVEIGSLQLDKPLQQHQIEAFALIRLPDSWDRSFQEYQPLLSGDGSIIGMEKPI
jgi:hypothetical protein